jgi:threonine dehydratase
MANEDWKVEAEHLERAAEVVAEHALTTPLIPLPSLGHRVWLKLETDQRTGSFKLRGALAKLASLTPSEKRRGVVTASAGNHGLGVAEAARRLGIGARVYVPKGTPIVKRDGIARLGAHVVVTDAVGYDAAEEAARQAASELDAVFVSPFDDPWVAAGNGGTVGLEVLRQLGAVDAIIAPVGGGGLMAGLAAARSAAGRDSVKLIGVQSEACPAMHRSIETGAAVEKMKADGETLAEGLEGGVSKTSFARVQEAVERIDLVSEAAIADAMRFAHETVGVTLEGSAAVVVAWAREHLADFPGKDAVVLVLTGQNVDEHVRHRVLFGRETSIECL